MASYGEQYPQSYGSSFPQKRNRKNNYLIGLAALIVPIIIFASTCEFMILEQSAATYLVVFILLCVCLALIYLGVKARQRQGRFADPTFTSHNRWMLLLGGTSLLAWIAGVCCGEITYALYFSDYYTYSNMGVYSDVDTADVVSGQFMDAAVIYFADTAVLDSAHTMSFHNKHEYCVCPIASNTSSTSGTSTHQFWAVGKDCCSSRGDDFACGTVNSTLGGLRVLMGPDRDFYNLAVQQASAYYGYKVLDSTFVTLSDDPVEDIDDLKSSGYDIYADCVGIYVALQVCIIFVFLMVSS